ncbi:MAG: hypothetical protein GWN73_26015, partial [Actinobacteria bacterium]|nr:hypothetical protein [Actinomycetota bacterium]NIS33857.1 hypothetical protein [Actinomycetota bacterium]NIU68677.1 hypothetical protein [Actinomycetota bacterium]
PLEAVAHQRGWPVVVFARTRKRVVRATSAGIGAVAMATGSYALGRRHGRANARRPLGGRLSLRSS